MYIYIIMLLISIFFSILSKDKRLIIFSRVLQFLSAFSFFIISAIRYDVGTDYLYRYVTVYNMMKSGIDVTNLESGFKLLINICIYLSNDYQLLFIITSGIIIFPMFNIIYKKSSKPELSIIIFFLAGFFFQSLNILRQYIAISVLFVGYTYLIEKRYIKWIACFILAVLNHSSAIVGVFSLIMYFFNKEIKLFTILLCSLIIIIFNNSIENIINIIISMTRFNTYINSSYDVNRFMPIIFAKEVMVYLLIRYLYKNKKKNFKDTREDTFLINMQGIAIIFYSMSSIMSLFSRTYSYFSIFQLISIPNLISSDKLKSNQMILIAIFIILFSVFIFYTNIINNYNEVLPYMTIFNK